VEYSSQSVNAENPTGDLLSGAYATVALDITTAVPVLGVPPSSLIFDSRGLSVATVSSGDRVVLKAVTIARDLGRPSRSPRAWSQTIA
jgi:hypothetical protein